VLSLSLSISPSLISTSLLVAQHLHRAPPHGLPLHLLLGGGFRLAPGGRGRGGRGRVGGPPQGDVDGEEGEDQGAEQGDDGGGGLVCWVWGREGGESGERARRFTGGGRGSGRVEKKKGARGRECLSLSLGERGPPVFRALHVYAQRVHTHSLSTHVHGVCGPEREERREGWSVRAPERMEN